MKFGRASIAALGLIGMTSAVAAEQINIPAVSFVLRTAAASGDVAGEGGLGLLQNATGKYYAPVILPLAGAKVCRFSLVYRDFDEANITATLLKKTYVVGGSAFTAPVVMAALQSVGAVDAVRRNTTVAIAQRTVSVARTFYYVELNVPATPLQVIGVEIITQPTCP